MLLLLMIQLATMTPATQMWVAILLCFQDKRAQVDRISTKIFRKLKALLVIANIYWKDANNYEWSLCRNGPNHRNNQRVTVLLQRNRKSVRTQMSQMIYLLLKWFKLNTGSSLFQGLTGLKWHKYPKVEQT